MTIRYPGSSLSGADRQRRYRANNKEKVAAARTKYRHENSKWETDEAYLSRPFVAWDGEGITRDGRHDYVMLAYKDSDGEGDYLANPKGLGTAQIFDFLLAGLDENPKAIHVIYGGSYDFNMFLSDLTYGDLMEVYKRKFYVWNNYRIGWRRGKSFYLSRVNDEGKSLGKGLMLYDVVSFFQRPFVQACDEYLGTDWHKRDMIVKNKALRSTFEVSDIPEVKKYNDAELVNLVELVTELRIRLNKVGLRPRRWDGPGAVAAALLLREKVKDARATCPPEVAEAARYAYAGGRFELLKYGAVDRPAFEYDINSAYPAALRTVPNLAKGHWEHLTHADGPGAVLVDAEFALYHIIYTGEPETFNNPHPFFQRRESGAVCWPMQTMGWYWTPEIRMGREYIRKHGGEIFVLETWVFHPSTDELPFAFIDALYNKRRALKKAGDGANIGIKLGLNSLYGKLCQQVGWETKPDGTLRLPPFHQLEWAGYTTSWCRAEVMRACMDNLESVIAFETDAVFTSEPLNVKIGSELGDFEVTELKNLTYAQSGVWFGETLEGKQIVKTRGTDKGTLTREAVEAAMLETLFHDRKLMATQTRFVGAGVALHQGWKRWRTWETKPRKVTVYPFGKRMPIAMQADGVTPFRWTMAKQTSAVAWFQALDEFHKEQASWGRAPNEWHRTACPFSFDNESRAISCEFPIEWINPNPEMELLSTFRREGNDFIGDDETWDEFDGR